MGTEYIKLFEKLVTENEKLLVQYITRTDGCELNTAKDIAQEVFITAWINIEKLNEHPNPVGWIFKTAGHIVRREMDRAYHVAEQSKEDVDFIGASDVDLPMEHFLPKGLNKTECDIILLRLEGALSFELIAEKLGMRDAACRKQYSRAIGHCRTLMEHEISRERRREVHALK